LLCKVCRYFIAGKSAKHCGGEGEKAKNQAFSEKEFVMSLFGAPKRDESIVVRYGRISRMKIGMDTFLNSAFWPEFFPQASCSLDVLLLRGKTKGKWLAIS